MTITYRPGTLEDSYLVFQVFAQSLIDLGTCTNVMAITGGNDLQVMQSLWQRRRPMFSFSPKRPLFMKWLFVFIGYVTVL